MYNKFIKRSSFIILFISIFISSFAQNNDNKKIIYLKGKITSMETDRPVAFAHIIDINNRSVTVSDTLGEFGLTILKGDTLRISSIGFEHYFISLMDSTTNNDEFFVSIRMLTRSYSLSEIDVYRLRWAEFEFEFLNTDIESNETGEKIKKLIFTKEFTENLQYEKLAQSSGVLLAFDVPNWKTKSRAKVKKMEEDDQLQKLIEEKYNEKLIKKITNLQDEALKDFINFCNLDPIYIINTSDYEIVTRIKSLYRIYKRKSF